MKSSSSSTTLLLLIFLVAIANIKESNSDEIKCLCSPCGYPCTPPASPPPPPPSSPPPPPSCPPPPKPPACPPPPSGGGGGGDWPPQSPSVPYSPYLPYVTPGVLYPVDPAYRPSPASKNSVHIWSLLSFVLGLFL